MKENSEQSVESMGYFLQKSHEPEKEQTPFEYAVRTLDFKTIATILTSQIHPTSEEAMITPFEAFHGLVPLELQQELLVILITNNKHYLARVLIQTNPDILINKRADVSLLLMVLENSHIRYLQTLYDTMLRRNPPLLTAITKSLTTEEKIRILQILKQKDRVGLINLFLLNASFREVHESIANVKIETVLAASEQMSFAPEGNQTVANLASPAASNLLQNSMLRNKPTLPSAHQTHGAGQDKVASTSFDNRPK